MSCGSQKDLDEKIKSSLAMERRDVDKQLTDLASNSSEIGGFGADVIEKLRDANRGLGKFLHEDLRRDAPTGQTPSRVQTEFPRLLVQGTPDEERVKRFRQQMVPATLDMDGIAEDDDDSVVSQVFYHHRWISFETWILVTVFKRICLCS